MRMGMENFKCFHQGITNISLPLKNGVRDIFSIFDKMSRHIVSFDKLS